jgi:phospholipid/cholesterol/gamma-HCH transport system substrate-binding protein
MENRSHALMTGFFTLALLIATILAGIWFNRDTVTRVPYEIATTQSIPGLNPQATVRYRGLEVGRVEEILFDEKIAGQILIRLGIDENAPITKTTFASLGYQGVTGIAFIQLDDEKTGSPRLATSTDQPARIALRPGFLDQLEKRGLVILEKAESLTARADELLSPANQKAIMAAVDKIGRAASAFEAVPKQLEPTLARLPVLLDKADRSLAKFDSFSDNAARMSNNYDRLATSLQAADGPINKLTGTIDRVGGSLEGVISSLEMQTLPHFVAMTDEARTSLRAVKRTANSLGDRPQSILFGTPNAAPGPGEPGFEPPSK